MKPKQKKNNKSFLSCVKEQIHICFRKFSERTNLKLIFFLFLPLQANVGC